MSAWPVRLTTLRPPDVAAGVLGWMHPQIQWTETAPYKYGGVYGSPQAVLENVFGKMPADSESFSIEIRFDQYVDSATINPLIGA